MILSIVTFSLCGAALVIATMFLRRGDPEATVTGMFDRMMADRVVRVAVLLIWWWLGWHFLAGQTTEAPIP
ncbi:MAG: DUF6186 family protein [Leucobacter sp.]